MTFPFPSKTSLVAALCVMVPAAAFAQSGSGSSPSNATAKSTPTVTAKKPVVKKSSAEIRRSALKAVEEVTPIDEDLNITLSAEDIELAKRVYVGSIPCELGAAVSITPNEKRPGFFMVQTKNTRFTMHPVESRTGAIRLEDPKAGALWLQLGNKSMLMSQKMGQRLADECMSQAQITFADEIKKNPPISILDPLPIAKK